MKYDQVFDNPFQALAKYGSWVIKDIHYPPVSLLATCEPHQYNQNTLWCFTG